MMEKLEVYFTKFWRYISYLGTNENQTNLKSLQIQLLNQYNFFLGIIFLGYAIRDLSYQMLHSGIVCGLVAATFLISLFTTRIRFTKRYLFVVCCAIALLIFYFSSFTGPHSGTYIYNFVFLGAILFLFGAKDLFYIIGIYALTFLLFLINYFTDFALFFNASYLSPQLCKETFGICYVQTLGLSCFNGIYLLKRYNLHLSIIRSRYRLISELRNKDQSIALLTEKVNKELSYSMQELVETAKHNPSEFLPRFQQVYPDFYTILLKYNPKLTTTEFKTLALIELGFLTKDIAVLEYVSIRTIETRKNRIRKNFGLSANTDLYQWLNTINPR